jgi:hypothetical protein
MDNKIVLLAIVLILGGVMYVFYQIPVQKNIVFVSDVEGCAANLSNPSNQSNPPISAKSFKNEQEPDIEVIEDKIVYSRAISHLCCRKVELKHEVEGSTINIYEVWSGVGCKCICFSRITAKLSTAAGEYTVNVYETGTKPNGEPMGRKLIISKVVDVNTRN